MLFRTLGKTDWSISVIGFGAWGIGGAKSPRQALANALTGVATLSEDEMARVNAVTVSMTTLK